MSKSTTAYTFNQKEDDAITPGRCIENDCSQIVNKQHNKQPDKGDLEEYKFWPEYDYDEE